jgi:TetR/AcrR family transcriptional regulator, fatty acid metabolism regulator protein
MRSEQANQDRTFIERARRQQLVAAAIDQLAESGYAGTTLAAVAARAGVSKGAVLYHFTGGKDELLGELVNTVIEDARVAMTSAMQAEDSIADIFRTYIRSNVRFMAEHRPQMLALASVINGAGPRPDGSSMYEPVSERVVVELAGLLKAGQDAGAFGSFSPMVVARTVRGAIDALEPVLRHHPEVDLDVYAAELMALFDKVVAP